MCSETHLLRYSASLPDDDAYARPLLDSTDLGRKAIVVSWACEHHTHTMPDDISVTFLGTAAGRPCATRNVSSLAIKIDSAVWVVDAGEGTQHQFMNEKCKLKMSQVTKIFVTHMHADHIMGLPGLLCTISAGDGGVIPGEEDPRHEKAKRDRDAVEASRKKQTDPVAKHRAKPPRVIEIYGPKGLRAFVRQSLKSTYAVLSRPYQVTELLFPDETPSDADVETTSGLSPLHENEIVGRDVVQQDGVWKSFATALDIDISAGPILHTVPCIGYIFTEADRPLPLVPSDYIPHLLKPINAEAIKMQGIRDPRSLLSVLSRDRQPVTLEDGTTLLPPAIEGPGRKVVILGDTYDATPCVDLALDATLVVHESTNAYLPNLDQDQAKPEITFETVKEKARLHGHSVPEVAGAFASKSRTKDLLVLNHLSVKYPHVDPHVDDEELPNILKVKKACLKEIGRLASVAWGSGKQAIVAHDFLVVQVPKPSRRKDSDAA